VTSALPRRLLLAGTASLLVPLAIAPLRSQPAPGTQAEFGARMQAWFESGAVCPAE
jgi:hypothetical protein